MHVTTPPIESPLTRTLSMAAIIFSAYSGSGHLTMLLSIWNLKHSANERKDYPCNALERKVVKRRYLFQSYSLIINCIFWKYNLMHFRNKCQNLHVDDVLPSGFRIIYRSKREGLPFCSGNENAKGKFITPGEYLHRLNYTIFRSSKNQDPSPSKIRSAV